MIMRSVATIQETKNEVQRLNSRLEPAKPDPLSSAAQACATARPPGEEESAGLGSPPVTVRIQISAQPPYATASHQDLENYVEQDSREKLIVILIYF